MKQNSIEIIKLLKETNSSNEKKKIIKEQFDEELHGIFSCACDDSVYNFKKLKKEPVFADELSPQAFDNFLIVLRNLNTRNITGDKAQLAIQKFILENSTKEAWEFVFFPILKKDMRCGVSKTLYNNAVKDIEDGKYLILSWQPMGAVSSDRPKDFLGKKIVEPKHDGVRVIIFYNSVTKKCQVVSRNNKEYKNFKHIEEEIIDLKFPKSLMLDGEIVSDSFQKLSKQLQRKEDVDCSDAIYHVFDIVCDGQKPLIERKLFSKLICENFTSGKILYSGFEEHCVTDEKLALQYYENLMNEYVNKGYEGIVIKEPLSDYMYEKSKFWIKMKKTETIDLEIVGFCEGEGKYKNMLGNLILEGYDENFPGKYFKVNVGVGISDEIREYVWNNKEKFINKKAEILFDSITRANNSETYSLRFPRFLKIRMDKS